WQAILARDERARRPDFADPHDIGPLRCEQGAADEDAFPHCFAGRLDIFSGSSHFEPILGQSGRLCPASMRIGFRTLVSRTLRMTVQCAFAPVACARDNAKPPLR